MYVQGLSESAFQLKGKIIKFLSILYLKLTLLINSD